MGKKGETINRRFDDPQCLDLVRFSIHPIQISFGFGPESFCVLQFRLTDQNASSIMLLALNKKNADKDAQNKQKIEFVKIC